MSTEPTPDRIPLLRFEDLEPALAAALRPRYQRLGYLGQFFRFMGHQPDALRAFVDFTEHSKAALDPRCVEIIALTIAKASGNNYELNQHERLCIRKGFTREWVLQVEALQPLAGSAEPMSAQDRSIQNWVLAVVNRDFPRARSLFETVVTETGPARAAAALLVVGRYVAHSSMVQTLGLEPPVPSIFEDGFTGDNRP